MNKFTNSRVSHKNSGRSSKNNDSRDGTSSNKESSSFGPPGSFSLQD